MNLERKTSTAPYWALIAILIVFYLPDIAADFSALADFVGNANRMRALESSYGEQLDYNLGDIKDEVSSKERAKLLSLMAEIDEAVALRERRHTTTYGDEEYRARLAFNKLLDNVTERCYTWQDWDDTPLEEAANSNKARILEALKAVLSAEHYDQFLADYNAYSEGSGDSYYYKLFEPLAQYADLNGDLIVLLLDQYSLEEGKALYAIDAQLQLVEVPIVNAEHPAVTGNVSDDVRQSLWQLVGKIIVPEDLKDFDYLLISSDGVANTLASTVTSPNDDGTGERWLIQVDDADLDDELIATLIHEYAHYLTLNDDEVDYIASFRRDRYCEDGVVAKKDSLLTQFYLRFWQDYVIDDLYETSYAFYVRNQTSFVSEYAATNASEDIAECFSFFVLDDKPTDDSIASQKILFFYEMPQCVALRTTIRQALQLD